MTVTVNSLVLTNTLRINETGSFIFFINTAGADPGEYFVTVSENPSASAYFFLDANAPVRQQEGGGDTLSVPAGIAIQPRIYVPLTRR